MFEFYTSDDVMQMLGCSRAKAYNEIKLLNLELEAKGKRYYPGKVSKKYFEERWG